MRNIEPNNDLDATDRAILRLLQKNGSLPNAKLAEVLSLSVTPCWRRLKRLEDEGYIKGYHAELDRRKLGLGISTFVLLGFERTENPAKTLEDALAAYPEVTSCYMISGTADYVLQVVAADLDAYGEFVEKVLRVLPGIRSIQSNFVLREIKSQNSFPVPD